MTTILLCSGASRYQTQLDYHRSRYIFCQKQILEWQKKAQYHQERVYYYEKEQAKEQSKEQAKGKKK
jgi:hypothetical protein